MYPSEGLCILRLILKVCEDFLQDRNNRRADLGGDFPQREIFPISMLGADVDFSARDAGNVGDGHVVDFVPVWVAIELVRTRENAIQR